MSVKNLISFSRVAQTVLFYIICRTINSSRSITKNTFSLCSPALFSPGAWGER